MGGCVYVEGGGGLQVKLGLAKMYCLKITKAVEIPSLLNTFDCSILF